MKRIIAILTIFYCAVATASTSYESMLEQLWDQVSTDMMLDQDRGFLSQDIHSFFEGEPSDRLIFFFPKGSIFDQMVSDDRGFIDLEDFFEIADEYGYELSYCSSQRHLVSFKNRDEIEHFVKKVFNSELIEEEIPLYFPSKLIIARATPYDGRSKTQYPSSSLSPR